MTIPTTTTNLSTSGVVGGGGASGMMKWKRVNVQAGPSPRPRHGHRAVSYRDLMIVFGGGNEGIVDELHVFNASTQQWFVPECKGDVPPGSAAYGMAVVGAESTSPRVVIFGGMIEYGKYSNDLYSLKLTNWEWRKLASDVDKASMPNYPSPRLGHSFTLAHDGKIYLFGGLENESKDPKENIPRYLNDFYSLEFYGDTPGSFKWTNISQLTYTEVPSPRESHTCVAYANKDLSMPRLCVYGGMSGTRLGDLWLYYLDQRAWTRVNVNGQIPLPRSLHSATCIRNRMFIFGGWVPLNMITNNNEISSPSSSNLPTEWKCTNTLAAFNFDTFSWETLNLQQQFITSSNNNEDSESAGPRARAGHSAVEVHNRLYLWSGRDGYRKAWNNQVCCKDLWYLETEVPPAPGKVQLTKPTTNSLEVNWSAVPTAEQYVLQIQRVENFLNKSNPSSAAALLAQPQSAGLHSPILQQQVASKNQQPPPILQLIPAAPGTNQAEFAQAFTALAAQQPQSSSSLSLLSTAAAAASAATGLIPTHQPIILNNPIDEKMKPGSIMNPRATITAVPLTAGMDASQLMVQFQQSASGGAVNTKGEPINILNVNSTAGGQLIYATAAQHQQQQITSHMNNLNLLNHAADLLSSLSPSSGQQTASNASNNVNIAVPIQLSSSGTTQPQVSNQNTAGGSSSQGKPIINLPKTIAHLTSNNNNNSSNNTNMSTSSNQSSIIPLNTSSITPLPIVMNANVTSSSSATSMISTQVGNNAPPPILTLLKNPTISQMSSGVQKIITKPSNTQFSNNIAPTASNSSTVVKLVTTNPTNATTITTTTTTPGGMVGSSTSTTTTTTTPKIININSTNTGSAGSVGNPATNKPPTFIVKTTSGFGRASTSVTPGNQAIQVSKLNLPMSGLQTTPSSTSSQQPAQLSKGDQLDGVNDHLAEHDFNTGASTLIPINNIFGTEQTLGFVNTGSLWHDVAITKDLSMIVSEYNVIMAKSQTQSGSMDENVIKKKLEPGVAYKFRVAGINSCGRGPWSEQSAFVTCQPGFPGAPSNIKISKSGTSAHIYWEPPQDQDCGPIKEYSVYLQVKPKSNDPSAITKPPGTPSDLNFIQIYRGTESNCVVVADTLAQAYIDQTSKPAILFRIAAKNEKGYGPATQVRWLQDNVSSSKDSDPSGVKRSSSQGAGTVKKKKDQS